MISLGRNRVLLRSLGEKIKNLRKRENLTQEEFAVNLNISLDTVKNWEQGYNYPSVDMLVTIAEYFKCDFDYLLGKQDTPNKEYKHFSEYTGLSEEAIKTLLYFCRKGSVLPEILENKDFIFYLDEIINEKYKAFFKFYFHNPDDFSMNSEDTIEYTNLGRAAKLELYNCLSDFINNARKKRDLEPI